MNKSRVLPLIDQQERNDVRHRVSRFRFAAGTPLSAMRRRATSVPVCLCVACALASFVAVPAWSQYPEKPIRMLVGFAPGGGTDATARAISQPLSQAVGQQVIVDNRPGAAGNIAADLASKAVPDGYTMLMGTVAALAINVSLYQKLPYDPQRDLEPVTLAVSSTNVLVVHPSVPVRSVKELIAFTRANPGKLSYGSSGVGGPGHLAGVLFDQLAGTDMVHVPYKGGAPAMLALVSGEVDLVFATAETAFPQIRGGKVRALGVTTAARAAAMPELLTIAEAGVPAFDANNWYGVMVPAKTPRAIIESLNHHIVKILNDRATKEILFKQGLDVCPTSPQEFGDYIKSEIAKWAKVVKASGAKPL